MHIQILGSMYDGQNKKKKKKRFEDQSVGKFQLEMEEVNRQHEM